MHGNFKRGLLTKKKKKGEKRKKNEKPCLDSHSNPIPSPPIKTTLKKNPHQGEVIKTQIKKERKKNISNKVQLFLFGNNNNKNPTRHNKLTNQKWTLW